MKWLTLLLALFVAFPCAAQKNVMKGLIGHETLKKAMGPNVNPKLLRTARISQGKILLGGRKPISQPNVNLDKYVFQRVQPTNVAKLPILLYEPSPKEWSNAVLAYVQVMDAFKQFKKEMDIFLYYQSKPGESRQLAGAEKAEWLQKISGMRARLGTLKNIISPNDPAYKAAREYVAYAAGVIDPTLRGMMSEYRIIRKDREYKMDEFFLHTPEGNKGSSLMGMMPLSVRAAQLNRKLPQGLKMAVLNDRESILKRMKDLNSKVFFPSWEITTFKNTEELLRAMLVHGQQFDVILTDIIVPGGGGYYLTGTLRDKGYNGVIIALSSYQEEKGLGDGLFNRGFDGMVSLPIGFEEGKEWPYTIMKDMHNYFYYRDLNGWNR